MSLYDDGYQYERSWALEPELYTAPFPEGMEPFPFQLAGVEYALNRDHAIIGDQPGLGKTMQAILVSNAIEAENTLVVCPASLRLNWLREIWDWSTIEGVKASATLKSQDGVSSKANYVVISYDLLRNPSILNAIMDLTWDHLVLDEAHYLKDPKGNARTQVITASDLLPAVCGRITMLTGTLMPNQPIECYNAARLLDWDCIEQMSLEEFRDHYYTKGGAMVRKKVLHKGMKSGKYQEWESFDLVWDKDARTKPVNLDELRWRLRTYLMVRRLKQDVLPQLPPVIWHPFPITMTTKVKKALNHEGWKTARKLYELDQGTFDTSIPVDGAIATARREVGMATAPLVGDYVEDMFLSGYKKIIVAAYHRDTLHYLRDRLTKYGLVYMDGSTSTVAKQKAVDAFQNDDRVGVCLGQTITLMQGWNLHAAQDVVVAEIDWVPGNNEQLLDRVCRIGQTGLSLTGHVPWVPDTLYEKILGRNIEKGRSINQALDGR